MGQCLRSQEYLYLIHFLKYTTSIECLEKVFIPLKLFHKKVGTFWTKWQKTSTTHYPEHTIPIMKHGGGSIICGDVFSWQGQGSYIEINEKWMELNRIILKDKMLEAAKDLRLKWRLTFEQDNGPKHTTRPTME